MKRIGLTIAVLFVSLYPAFKACAEEIKINGGPTAIETVLKPVKEPFEKSTGIKLYASAQGSKNSIINLDKGLVDAASAAHTLEELMGMAEKEKIDLKNKALLQSAVLTPGTRYVFIAHKSNPVTKLSKEQLKDIYLGKIASWKEVGGNEAPTLVVWSKFTLGTNDYLTKKILDGAPPTKDVLDVISAEHVRQNVAANPEAIGIVSSAYADGSVKVIETQELKTSPIIMVTVGAPSPKVQKLIDFIKGEGKEYLRP